MLKCSNQFRNTTFMIIKFNLGRTSEFHKKHAYVNSVVSMNMCPINIKRVY